MDEKDFYVEDPPARCRICWSLESHVAVLVSSLPAYYASRRRLALLPLGRSGNLEGVLPFLHLLFLCFDTPFVCRSCVCLYTHTERHFVDRKKKKMDLPSEMRKKCEVCDWWKLPRGCKEMKFFILWCWYTCLNIILVQWNLFWTSQCTFPLLYCLPVRHSFQGVWGLFLLWGADKLVLVLEGCIRCICAPMPFSLFNNQYTC